MNHIRNVAAGMLVEVAGLEVRVKSRVLVTGIELSVNAGEIVSVIGPNGAGKTTLIRAVLGLVAPTSGRVRLRPGARIGYVPQRLTLNPNLPMTVRRFVGLSGPMEKGRRQQVLDEVGVGHVADSSVHDISGGELQRTLLARALLRDPDLLVLDEPAQGVDVTGQSELYALIERIRNERGCGVLMVSHDLHLVMSATDKVVCINGHLCCAGRPDAVSQHPEYVALFGSEAARSLALYHHHHDHTHDIDGHVHHEHGGDDHAHHDAAPHDHAHHGHDHSHG
jgi:zinc transport system ATP-binding protein